MRLCRAHSKHLRRYTCNDRIRLYILRHNGSCTDYCTASNLDAIKNAAIRADPNVVLYSYPSSNRALSGNGHIQSRELMIRCNDNSVGGNPNIISNCHAAMPIHRDKWIE